MSSVALTALNARRSAVGVGAILFLSLFASQAALILPFSPVLAQVAADLDVSTAAAGQLRTVAGVASGTAALILAFSKTARRATLRDLLVAGAALLAVASLASAAAPGYAALAAAQVLVGVAVALLVTAGTAAAGEWSAPEQRRQVLSWTLSGMPAAWIVGMPLIGVLVRWTGATPGSRSRSWPPAPPASQPPPALVRRTGRFRAEACSPRSSCPPPGVGWLASCWPARRGPGRSSTRARCSASRTGSRRRPPASRSRSWLSRSSAGRFLPRLFKRGRTRRADSARSRAGCRRGTLRCRSPGVIASTVLLSVAAFLAGGRVLAGNAFGLDADPPRRLAVMGARAAANQYGYFVGSAVGGVALAQAGYTGLGIVLGMLRRRGNDLALGPVTPW